MWTDEKIEQELRGLYGAGGGIRLVTVAPIMQQMRASMVAAINEMSGDLATYERIVSEYDAKFAAQHEAIERLEAQLEREDGNMATETKSIKILDSKEIKRIANSVMLERFDFEEVENHSAGQWAMIFDAVVAGIKAAMAAQDDM